MYVAAYHFPDAFIELVNLAIFFKYRDELARREETVFRVYPAGESLAAAESV